MAITRIDPATRYSEAVIVNGLVFMSGMVPNIDGDIKVQTQDVLQQIDTLLTRIGSDKSKLVDATIYLSSLADYAGMNEIWDAWLLEGCAPARATVEAKLANANWKVEIKMIAAI